MYKSLVFGAFVFLLGSAAAAAAVPSLPAEPGYALGSFISPEAGAGAWVAYRDSAPAAIVDAGPRKAFRMPCTFGTSDSPRSSWDAPVKLDMGACRGLKFRFFCPDATPVAFFNIYFKSGAGWYSTTFAAEQPDGWTVVTVPKVATSLEETPAGWSAVEGIRISAWEGANANTEFYVADFALIDADAEVAIIRNETAGTSDSEIRSVAKFTQVVSELLDELGVPHALIGDSDLKATHLAGKKAVVLPYCPAPPQPALDTLRAYIAGGGKIVSFYHLPGDLPDRLGFRRGNHVPKQYDGQFAGIRPQGAVLNGLPADAAQASWNIGEVLPVEGKSRIAAMWHDSTGKSTGHAAILVSDNGAHMTHVLLSDDRANKRQLLLAMLGRFVPGLWPQVVERQVSMAGGIARYSGFEQAEADILRQAAGNAAARNDMEKASTARASALALVAEKRYGDAMSAAGEAQRLLRLAYCAVQRPLPGEHRAFWCHSAFGVDGMTWDEAVRTLADNGFTAILPNMLWGGLAYYPSKVLPVAGDVAERGDQVALCLEACKKYGIECHVWKVNWNMGHRIDPDFASRMKREGRTQVTFAGEAKDAWLCPSHPDNQALEIASMVEVARNYAVDGVHFDYIRYPDENACFCAGCRARFEARLGRKVSAWPGDTRANPDIQQAWYAFRRDNITKVVKAVSEQARAVRPGIKISAAVFRNWPRDRDTIGQDWKTWCDSGYLDFVCPMDYTESNITFENMVGQQLEWTGRVPCYPGIGLSVWADPSDIGKLIDQIEITRSKGTGGFTVFNYNVLEAREMVPLCGKGITRK